MLPIVNRRDAVGKLAYNLHLLLKRNQHESLIVTERRRSLWGLGPFRDGLLAPNIADWAMLACDRPAVAIYHHSIGTRVAEHFLNLPAPKKIVIYHGITPPELLSPTERSAAISGLKQLGEIAGRSDVATAFSSVTRRELIESGAQTVIELPYYLPSPLRTNALKSRLPLALIVGRVVRHKRVIEGIRALMLVKKSLPELRLIIIGSLKADREYASDVEHLVHSERLEEWVRLRGRISQWSLDRLYQKASWWLSLSAHEGFCVPALEALRAGLGIVAFNGTALSETVGEAGELVSSTEPEVVSAAVFRAINKCDPDGVQKHLERFSPELFETGFLKALV